MRLKDSTILPYSIIEKMRMRKQVEKSRNHNQKVLELNVANKVPYSFFFLRTMSQIAGPFLAFPGVSFNVVGETI